MRKFLLVLTGVAIGVTILLAASVSLVWLTSANEVTFLVYNDSKTVLHNATLVVPGSADSRMEPMLPGQAFGNGMPARRKVVFRLLFDAEGQHYEFPGEARALPFGLWTVSVHIDDRMQISVKTYGTFRA